MLEKIINLILYNARNTLGFGVSYEYQVRSWELGEEKKKKEALIKSQIIL